MEEIIIEFLTWAWEKIGEKFIEILIKKGCEYVIEKAGQLIVITVRWAGKHLKNMVEAIASSLVKDNWKILLGIAIAQKALSPSLLGLGIVPFGPLFWIAAAAALGTILPRLNTAVYQFV